MSMQAIKRAGRLALLCLAACAALPGTAATEPAPVSAYVKPPDFAGVKLSPNGRYIAALGPLFGQRNLVVLDLETMKTRAVTGLNEFDVTQFHWVGSQYLVFETGKIDQPRGLQFDDQGGLFSVRVDGENYRKLGDNIADAIKRNSSEWIRTEFMRAAPGSETDILVSSNARINHERDVYRINLETGIRTLLTFERPNLVNRWILDGNGVPRALVKQRARDVPASEQLTTVMFRDAADQPWRELASFKGDDDTAAWLPRAFTPDGRDLIVEARAQEDVTSLYRYDVAKGRLAGKLLETPRYDAAATQLQRDHEGRLVAALTRDDRFSTTFFDRPFAELHAELQAVFKDKKIIVQRSSAGRALVEVWSDRSPHAYYLFDEASAKLKLVLRSRADLDEKHLVEMRPFLLKTRDGLEIPSYYFLPANHQPGQKLPTVVHIHGGPHVRADRWGPLSGFGVMEAQILASRGYAVVLPNFRITPELGRKIYEAGFGQVGRKMSDDHEDAARWAVEQGFADADRICISGSSYGGYASLWATVRSAAVFRCAIPGLLVSDQKLQKGSADYRHSKSAIAYWKRLLGVKDDDWSSVEEISPLKFAERSALPMFIWAGANDERTPLSETRNIVAALEKAGKPAEIVMIKPGEGHGYGKQENRIDLYETMLKFLDRHIGSSWKPRASAAAAADGQAAR